MARGEVKVAEWFTRLTAGINRNLVADAARKALIRWVRRPWFKKILPQHFKEGAGRKYPGAYLPRGRGYQRDKQKAKGHRRPMVWSGQFMRGMLGREPSPTGKASGRSITVKAKLKVGNRAANLWSGKRKSAAGNAHDFRRSIAATNKADHAKFVKFMRRMMLVQLQESKRRGQRKKTTRFAA